MLHSFATHRRVEFWLATTLLMLFLYARAFPQELLREVFPPSTHVSPSNGEPTPAASYNISLARQHGLKEAMGPNNIKFTLSRQGGDLVLIGSGSGSYRYWSADRYRHGTIDYTLDISFMLTAASQQLTDNGAEYILQNRGGVINIHWVSWDTVGYSVKGLDIPMSYSCGPGVGTDGKLSFSSVNANVSALKFPLPYTIPSGLLSLKRIEYSRELKACFALITPPSGFAFAETLDIPQTAYGTYKGEFELGLHAWSFAHCAKDYWPGTNVMDTLVWHREHWRQFDYRVSPPAPRGYECPQGLTPCDKSPSDFPDWPLFENTFGRDQIYGPTGSAYPLESAVNIWMDLKKYWNGSCFGLATSALDSFAYSPNQLRVRSFYIGAAEAINHSYLLQFGAQEKGHLERNNCSTTPDSTARDIIRMFILKDRADYSILDIHPVTDNGGHAVNPISVDESAEAYTIYVYDNNFPKIETQIDIDRRNNPNIWYDYKYTSSFRPDLVWGGNVGLFLSLPIKELRKTPILCGVGKNSPAKTLGRPGLSLVYVSPWTELNLTDVRSARPIRFGPVGSGVIENMNERPAIIPSVGRPTMPQEFILPSTDYRIRLRSVRDSPTSASMIGDSLHFVFKQDSLITSGLFDIHCAGQDLTVSNADTTLHRFRVTTILALSESERVCEFSSCWSMPGDSLTFSVLSNDGTELSGGKYPNGYDLSLRLTSSSGKIRFEHRKITLDAGSRHRVVPCWQSLDTSHVLILVDRDHDGLFDDSMMIANEYTGPTRVADEPVLLPTESELLQNFPNPFNAGTNIQFRMGGTSPATLKVYSITGELVRTLVDEVLPSGVYSVRWDGTDSRGQSVATGMYIYEFISGRVATTKKLIILR
jgi:hypothetical protein